MACNVYQNIDDGVKEPADEEPEKESEKEEDKKPVESAHPDDETEGRNSSNNEKRSFMRKAFIAAGVGTAATVVGILAAPVIASAALGAAGFGASGVVAGSAAAGVQSAIGNVAAGSLFSACQSAGATGVIGSAATAAIGAGTGLSGLGATLAASKLFGKSPDTTKLLICGSGVGAHALVGIASAKEDLNVRVLSLNEDERWNGALQKKKLEVTFQCKTKESTRISSKPTLITKNPKDAMEDVDAVVFVLPASAHQLYFKTLKPHIKPGTVIVGLPGHPGFVLQARHLLGVTGRQCTLIHFESLPWECRITEFGAKCEVFSIKQSLMGAIKEGDVPPRKDPVPTLQCLLGPIPKLIVSGHPLAVDLMSVNSYLHTSIMYGQWEGWDGIPLGQRPPFYNGLTEPTAILISSISEEIKEIAKLLELKTGADMSKVVHIYDWYLRCYSEEISDKTDLYTVIKTNAVYQSLKHPVEKTADGKFVPDYTSRYMTEDIPYGLAVIRGIAEIVGLETPNIDEVLSWSQRQMDKEYLINSKLQGKDILTSRAPQRYGFNSLESIL